MLKQDDPGDNFYLIEEGKAVFYKTASDGSQQKVNELNKGDYFGGKIDFEKKNSNNNPQFIRTCTIK